MLSQSMHFLCRPAGRIYKPSFAILGAVAGITLPSVLVLAATLLNEYFDSEHFESKYFRCEFFETVVKLFGSETFRVLENLVQSVCVFGGTLMGV